ncbi:unnamed protein product [Closterium sp. NIES-54]
MVQQVLQRVEFTYSSPQSTPLPTGHSLSAPPSDESVEPSGPYPELVGCLITSGMGLVLGGRARVVLTGHAAVVTGLHLQSCCEAEIYAGAMAAQELRWLTYLLTDLGEAPRSPPVLYVDNKAMLALCQEHRLEHRTKHIALRYFLARELQQRGQLRLAYVASQANTADVFTKALQPSPPCWPRVALPWMSRRPPSRRVALLDAASTCPAHALHCWQPRRPALPVHSLALLVRRPAAHTALLLAPPYSCPPCCAPPCCCPTPSCPRATLLPAHCPAGTSTAADTALLRATLLAPPATADTFPTVENLITHLRTSDTRYRAALPAEFLDKNPPPIFITLYFIVTRLLDSLRAARDHFLALDPTDLNVDLLEKQLLPAETSVVVVGASRGTPHTPFFEGCSPPPRPLPPPTLLLLLLTSLVLRMSGLLLLLVGTAATARARVARVVAMTVGVVVVAVVEAVEVAEVVTTVGVVARVGASVTMVVAAVVVAVVAAVGVVAVGVELFRGERGASGGSVRCPYVIRTGDRAGQTCGKFHSQHHYFSRIDNAWRVEFGDEAERPRWEEMLRSGVDMFALYFDAILAAMYALSVSAEGDCYQCVPPDPGIEAAALGASESALLGTAPAEALHTFTLDSGASHCVFRASTTLTPLPAPVPVRLADPPGGLVLARSSTVLPCPAVPSGSLSGLHLPSFSTTPRAALCSCRLLSHQTLLWHHRLGHPSLPRLHGMHSRILVSGLPRSLPPLPPSPAPPCLPCVKGRQRAAPHSSFPLTTSSLQTLHMDPVSNSSSGSTRTFLSCVCTLTEVPFTLPTSPQKNGVAERRIGLVMEVARTSMIHAAAPHFMWPFAVRYAAHQLNLWPRFSLPETSPTLRWTGKVGNASVFRIYHPTSRHVLSSQDIRFDELVTFYCLFPYRTAPLPPLALFLAPGPPPVDPLPPQGPAPSDVSHVDPLPLAKPVEVTVDSCVVTGTASGGAELASVEPGGAEPWGAEPEGVEPGGAESEGAESGGLCLPFPPSPVPPYLPCIEARQSAAPHSSFPPTTAPLQTLHMDVWGPSRVSGQGRERYFLLVIDDYTRYTTVFPLCSKGEVLDVLIPWIRTVRLQLCEWFHEDLPVLCLHYDRGGEFSFELLQNFCRGEGILQSFTLPASSQQNGVAERRIGLVMEVACTSMIHAGAPHFLCHLAYTALDGEGWQCVGVLGLGLSCLCSRYFLGFPLDASGWQFYHPTSRRVMHSQDVKFDKSVPFYHLSPYRTAPLPPRLLFLPLSPPLVDPLPPQGPSSSGVSHVDPLVEPVEVSVDSGAARGTASGGAAPTSAEPGGA